MLQFALKSTNFLSHPQHYRLCFQSNGSADFDFQFVLTGFADQMVV